MKILFLSHYFSPHIGGVEKHVYLLSRRLIKKGHEVTVITYKFDPKLKSRETIDGIKVIRFDYPKKKFIGLFYIWRFLFLKRSLLAAIDVIHIHDVFIWYLPFRFVYSHIKVYTTLHGYEPNNPFSLVSVFQKKLAVKFSNGTIGVGKFLEKYLNIKFDLVIYGAVKKFNIGRKQKNMIVFVGRLSKDTGVLQFLKWLRKNPKYKVDFVGDGEYRHECENFGVVHGFTTPDKFLAKAEYCVPGGYLACLEAIGAKCKIKIFLNSNLKKDYWQMSPMYKFIKSEDINGAYEWVKKQSWEKLTNDYMKLWNL